MPTPPAFCSHLPMFRPMMFRNTAANNIRKEPTIRNVRFSRKMRCSASADVGHHRRAGHQQSGKIEEGVDPVRPAGHKAVKFAERLFRPDVQAALVRKARGKFDDDERRRQKKHRRGKHPQADRGSAVVRRGRDPARPQHRGDIEEQDIPKSHHAAKLLFRICWSCGLIAHAVTSSAGISSSCSRKLRRNGSWEASSSAHVPKNFTPPSCRKITRSASFFARCVSCVTTMEVL